VILLVLSKSGSPLGLPFFCLLNFRQHCIPLWGRWCSEKGEEAAEKRHPAENHCRFSGIAALPWPAKPRFPGFFELAWGLLS
jgi:hypothetical protein